MAAVSSSLPILLDAQVKRQADQAPPSSPLRHIAIWDQHNKHLAPSLMEKIARVVFWPLYKLTMTLVLPTRSKYSKEDSHRIHADFQTSIERMSMFKESWKSLHKAVEITTPDGAILKGSFIQNAECEQNAPLVIFMQPSGAIYANHCFEEFLHYASIMGKRCNFLFFDYRGCGESMDSPLKAKDLIIDGDSAYLFARDHLHVPAQDIHMVGHSLGGGISAQVKAIRQECTGRYINDRSFSNITHAAYEYIGGGIIGTITKICMKILGWNVLNSSDALQKISSPTMITYHPCDQIIKRSAQLKTAPAQTNIQSINLHQPSYDDPNCFHGSKRREFTLENGENALDVIGNFIFQGIDEKANWNLFIWHLNNTSDHCRAEALKNNIVNFILTEQFLDEELDRAVLERIFLEESNVLLCEEHKAKIVKTFCTKVLTI